MAWLKSARWFTIGLSCVALSGCDGDGKTANHDPGPDGTADAGSELDGSVDPERDAGSPGDASAGDGGGSNTQIPDWFESKQVLDLKVSGALGDAFLAAFAGMPDGIVPPDRKKEPFAGNLSYTCADGTPHVAPVMLSLRGNSSLQECVFPKLKVAFETRVDAAADTFAGTRKLKIGTHCGEEDTVNGNIGRLRNEDAAFREEVVYQLARTLGITTMQTRPARIEYTDTSTKPAFLSPLVRKAFLLEHVDELARRLGAKAMPDPVSCGDDPAAKPEHQAVLRIKLFHAMIGNWDWALGPAEADGCGALMNTEVLVNADGSLTLVPADFDLAAFVVGQVRDPETNQLESITLKGAKASARTYLGPAVEGESAQALASIKAELLGKQAALRAVISASLMDDLGKQGGQLLLDGFFAVLAE